MARRTRRSPTRLVGLLQQADDRGEAESYALQRLHLCELELRAGDWAAAGHLLDEWAESAERGLLNLPMYERCRALLAMGRGHVDQARHSAAQAITRADAYGGGWDRLEALRARGTAALLRVIPRRRPPISARSTSTPSARAWRIPACSPSSRSWSKRLPSSAISTVPAR